MYYLNVKRLLIVGSLTAVGGADVGKRSAWGYSAGNWMIQRLDCLSVH